MAYETLVAPELTQELVKAGATLLQNLDQARVQIPAAFWLFSPDDAGWRLVLASPEVASLGAKAFYEKLFALLRSSGIHEVSPSYLTVTAPGDPLVQLLRVALKTGPGISTIRFTRNVINGILVPDVLIYRIL